MNKMVKLSCGLIFLVSSLANAGQVTNLNETRLSTIDNTAQRLSRPNHFASLVKGKEQIKQESSLTKIILKLQKIIAVKTSEKGGDELYFDVLEFGNDRKPKHFHIPSYPHHWPSFILNKIKDIPLWQGNLSKTSQVNIIVSLLEKDAPPWDLNDLIGSFKISMTLKNNKPQFVVQQQGASYSEMKFSGNFINELTLSGDDGEYKIFIEMK